jgi:hypothetical protein
VVSVLHVSTVIKSFDDVETGSLKVFQHCFNFETPALRWVLEYPAKLSVI